MSQTKTTPAPLFFRLLLLISVLVSLKALIGLWLEPRSFMSDYPGLSPDPLHQMPDVSSISHIPWRKAAFFDALTPLVVYENERLAWRREQLQQLQAYLQQAQPLAAADESLARGWLGEYGLDFKNQNTDWAEVFRRIDLVPADLVLMQAANESAWGTSRFAREANNLFGQWCFSRGCGLVPERRTSGMNHEVRRFATVQASVRSYMRNINTHRAYQELRQMRSSLREQGRTFDGRDLAPALVRYSERGMDYVNELLSMLQTNHALIEEALQKYQLNR